MPSVAFLTVISVLGDLDARVLFSFVSLVRVTQTHYCSCGALHIGDEILGIEGVGLEYTTLAEARQLLKGEERKKMSRKRVLLQARQIATPSKSNSFHISPRWTATTSRSYKRRYLSRENMLKFTVQ